MSGVLVGWRSCRWRLSLAAVCHATHTNPTFACAKEGLCWWAVVCPPLCGRPVSHLFKCSWKAPRPQSVSQTSCRIPDFLFSLSPGSCLSPGDAGRGRTGRVSHSCVTRFLPSMFVLLFPYSRFIWIEPSLESGGCCWRSRQIFSGRHVSKHSPNSLNLGNVFKIWFILDAVKWRNHCKRRFMCDQTKLNAFKMPTDSKLPQVG